MSKLQPWEFSPERRGLTMIPLHALVSRGVFE